MSLVNVGIMTLLAFLPNPSYNQLLLVWTIMNFAYAYIDSLAEGISAVQTKNLQRVAALEALNGKEGEGDDMMKAFGLYNAMRNFFRAIMMFIGGIVVQYTPLWVSAVIMIVYPLVLIGYTIFVFREKRVSFGLKSR